MPNRDGRRSATAWLDAVRAEERRGELLAAVDLAERGLSQHPGDLGLEHRAVLALARTGATEEATRRFEEYGLDGVVDEDVSALRARLAKDAALSATGIERARLAAQAATLYHAIFTRTRGYYPAINAATLWLVAGYAARSRELAGSVLDLVAGNGNSYYTVATEAEAHLLRGETRAAEVALVRAAAAHDGDYGALATTRRQLRLICDLLGIDAELLGPLAGPAVVHFCGHRLGGARFSPSNEGDVAKRVEEAVRATRIGYAYGSLASGADILWAEAILTAGGELHVVLPFARDEFVAWSVGPAGAAWVQRFERCLGAAASVRYATDDAFLGDDVLFRYGSELAMGLALLRARYLDADVRQLAVWDGGSASGAAGTAIDIATWERAGHAVTIVSPDRDAVAVGAGSGPVSPPHERTVPRQADARATRSAGTRSAGTRSAGSRPGRVVRALLFGDTRGFSTLTDEQLPVFSERFLGAFAEVLARHEDEIWHRNTWGDAVYVVLTDAVCAAACALELQEAVAAIDLPSVGLPEHLALRLGGHLGPVFPIHDPVVDAGAFMGSHVSRTARIEPVTPPGAVYVTEPFAAALVLAGCDRFTCDYVGHMPLAKDYGRLRMYRLRHG
ncbi:MAG: tetratricopeptide repeat-containing protein [Solirubrobacteraceae bacterium]